MLVMNRTQHRCSRATTLSLPPSLPALLLLFCATASVALPGLPTLAEAVPDHWEVRMQALDYLQAPVADLLRVPSQIVESRFDAPRVRIATEVSDEHVYLLFINELDGEFPLYAAGTYILRRLRSTGEIDQLKIFLRSDPRFFVRIWPDGSHRSVMSVFLAGYPLYQRIAIPMSIQAIMREPLERVLSVTAGRVDWQLFAPQEHQPGYEVIARMVERARAALPMLPDAEDGAMDANGNLVFIESLVLQDQLPGFNCSGFAKWIVDGVCGPLFGEYLRIEEMKEKHLELRGHRWSAPNEDARDPYFGLDWTRNLATALLSRARGSQIDPEAADVRSVPYHSYVEDMGFPIADLQQLLYLLALEEPGNFYLGSVNKEFGRAPVLRQHVHIAVLFPYFDHNGSFRVVVMERNVETSLESLDQRYHGDYIHLVRVAGTDSFSPPHIAR